MFISSLTKQIKRSSILIPIWRLTGSKIPPPHIYKQSVIKKHAKDFNISALVETGTYKGDMIEGVKSKFKRIVSIELSEYYFKQAKLKFKQDKHVSLILGDSSKELKKLLRTLEEPALFWLDGHFSGGKTAKGKLNTPIIQELNDILKHKIKNHVILIDDARLFTGKEDYPKINNLRKLIKTTNSNYNLALKDDIIRLTPRL